MRSVQVYDGRDIENIAGSFLALGSDGESDSAGDATSSMGGLAARNRQSVDTITCFVYSTSGDSAMKPRRDEVQAWFNEVRDVIAEDNTLGGAVKLAEIVSWTYRARFGPKGSSASVEFRVEFTTIPGGR